MNKAEFLENLPHMDPRSVPSEWMAEAWLIDWVREYHTSGLARQVSKVGELGYSKNYLDLLARSLSAVQLVLLYCDICDQSYRYEDEWREEFERTFPGCVSLLPPPQVIPGFDDFLNGGEMGVAWARRAWDDVRASGLITSHMAEDLRQGGKSWCRPDWMESLDLGLTRAELVRLYTELRDRSGRPEHEWRHVFEEAFPDCIPHFPGPLDPSEGA